MQTFVQLVAGGVLDRFPQRLMRICRYVLNSGAEASRSRLGVMDEGGIRDVSAATDLLPAQRWPLPPGDQLIGSLARCVVDRSPRACSAAHSALAVRLLSPVANPGKFICGVGNWSHHKAPLGMLGFLFKATSALAGEGEGVQVRWPDRTTLHEPELAIIIGRAVHQRL
jgi:2,4-diketo-3-deoxy-L-fuconate hydrolase